MLHTKEAFALTNDNDFESVKYWFNAGWRSGFALHSTCFNI